MEIYTGYLISIFEAMDNRACYFFLLFIASSCIFIIFVSVGKFDNSMGVRKRAD